jgi:alkylation response protein AidB-like acyl-CoA dehydrogenase
MAFLRQERQALAELLPGLDEVLARLPLLEMERPGNPALRAFKEYGGPGLLIPAAYGGRGAMPLQAVRVQRALGSRAPSLAVAATMHGFSVGALVDLAAAGPGPGVVLLGQIATHNLYVASGVAEGRSGASLLSSCLQVRRDAGGFLISGSKKPCSLSASMDLLTATLQLPPELGSALAVAVIHADTPGISRRPFWGSTVLAGAESDEVVLHNVAVSDAFVFPLDSEARAASLLEKGLLWFELLISATYLGIVSGLVERVLQAQKGTAAERAQLGVEVEGAMAALEGAARGLESGDLGNDALARMFFVRYGVQAAVERAAALAAELLGGLAFVSSPEVAYLLAAARALAFHPPSRIGVAPALDAYLAGGPLVVSC